MTVQGDRCGRRIASEDIPEGWGGWCCWRPTWEDHDECIWHAEDTRKSNSDLLDAWSEENTWPQKYSNLDLIRRLDETYLRAFRPDDEEEGLGFAIADPNADGFTSGGMFSNCTLFNSNFHNFKIGRMIDLSRVHLSGSDFSESDLSFRSIPSADFSNSKMRYTNLEGSLLHSTVFQDADLSGAIFDQANLFSVNLSGASLENAKLNNSYLVKTNFLDSNLERAEIQDSDLRDADFTGVRLHDALIRDIRINEGTDFGKKCAYEVESDSIAEGAFEEDSPTAPPSRNQIETVNFASRRFRRRFLGNDDGVEALDKAIRVYRIYQRLLREGSMPDDIRRFRIREKHSRRKRALAKGEYIGWFNYSVQRWSALYGEGVWRVIGISLISILLFGLVYPLYGMRVANLPDPVMYSNSGIEALPWVLGKGIYFSIITFTTLGYGDIQPHGWTAALASIESFLGVLLMALLVFVLGRRATW